MYYSNHGNLFYAKGKATTDVNLHNDVNLYISNNLTLSPVEFVNFPSLCINSINSLNVHIHNDAKIKFVVKTVITFLIFLNYCICSFSCIVPVTVRSRNWNFLFQFCYLFTFKKSPVVGILHTLNLVTSVWAVHYYIFFNNSTQIQSFHLWKPCYVE